MSDNVVVDSTDSLIDGDVKKVLHKRGRPTTALINANKKHGKVGRPAGDTARIAEFKARILSTKGTAVIEKILNTALEDGHPAQSACMKMVIDRALPMSMFDEKGGSSKPSITINIAGLDNPVVHASTEEVEEGEWSDD